LENGRITPWELKCPKEIDDANEKLVTEHFSAVYLLRGKVR
jgi:hypothetical protein